jgi:uncharacterized protein (TIGR02270 family)
MRLRIEVNHPSDGRVSETVFLESPIRIGRRPGNHIVLRHTYVSEPHALIEFSEGGVTIVDLGSRNGTFVAGALVQKDRPMRIESGVHLAIGPFILVVSPLGPDGGVELNGGPGRMALPLAGLPSTEPPAPGEFPPQPFSDPAPLPPIFPGSGADAPTPFAALPLVLKDPPAAWELPAPASQVHAEPPIAAVASRGRRVGPLLDIVEECFDEAAFLWRLWEDGLGSQARDLGTLSSFVEERLLGALDGIAVGGETAVESLLGPALSSNDRWRVTVAAHVAAASGIGGSLLMEILRDSQAEKLGWLVRGIELVRAGEERLAPLEAMLAQGSPAHRAALMGLRAFRRRPPGPELAQLLVSDEPASRAMALRAARFEPNAAALPAVEYGLGDPELSVCIEAVETGLRLGSRNAWLRCRELARTAVPGTARALQLVAALGLERDQEFVLAALGSEGGRKGALRALVHVGTVRAIEAALELLDDPASARLAAEAFSAITGLDLHAENLIAPDPPAPEEPIPFEEENLDADLVPGPDDLLPVPDVAGIKRWWDRARPRFGKGGRFVMGTPASFVALEAVLERGPMRRRHDVALEMAIRTGGRYDLEPRTFTVEQRRQMMAFATVRDGRTQPPALAGLVSRI